MRISRLIISAAALCGFAGAAHAEDGDWALHGFGDVSVKNDYVTPRGLVVTTKGATVQFLNGLVLAGPSGVTLHAGIWLDVNPGYDHAKNITAVNEFDYFVGIDKDIVPGLNVGVEYSQFISGQPSVAFNDEHNIEFSLKYKDKGFSGVTINPYAKLFWAVSGDSTVVLGKKGHTFDVEIGAVPTFKTGSVTISAPTWITVGPTTYWGRGGTGDGNLGVFSTGLKVSAPVTKGASVYAFGQYYNLINNNLVAAKALLNTGAGTSRSHGVFGAGFSYGF
jgi:hypothetical protein